jgi:hypothetical protein
MSVFIKAGLWVEKKIGYKGELNLTSLIEEYSQLGGIGPQGEVGPMGPQGLPGESGTGSSSSDTLLFNIELAASIIRTQAFILETLN